MSRDSKPSDTELLEWLVSGDPAVTWQVERDLLRRPRTHWKRTRRRVASEGWGARLLAHRAHDGTWGGGLYNPKWTSTFYTLRLLTQLGVIPTHRSCKQSCKLLLGEAATESGGAALWPSRKPDTCVTAMLVSMACYFGFGKDERTRRMQRWLLAEQMPDGGWNCLRHRGATHSSFHTTISSLEALAALQSALGANRNLARAAGRGHEFFLQHQLYRSSTTGRVVRPSFALLSFPPHWYFDVLRGLEYFASVETVWDARLQAPLSVLLDRRREDGRWPAAHQHPGKAHFELEPRRQPSRMNTLRALRVLSWAGSGSDTAAARTRSHGRSPHQKRRGTG